VEAVAGIRNNFLWRYTVGYCPECEAEIDEEFEDVGEIIVCPECGVELEVISTDPVEFDLAPLDDEDDDDWDDDDDEDWDDEDDDEDWDDEDDYDDDYDDDDR
jgi:alpha-aminoadipate carrier protein LysW